MSTLFLFGAGASKGSLDCRPYPPPLGCQLFDELRNEGGIASTIGGKLADLFRKDFEKGMDAFIDERNTDVIEFLRDMAKYFAQFEPGPNNLYRKLIMDLQGSKDKYIFSTINYDLLIEIAANQSGFNISHTGFSVPEDNILVIKMHGSCNFLPEVQPGQIRNVKLDVPRTGGAFDAPVYPGTPQEVIEFCNIQDSVAPAIAAYAHSKWRPICQNFIKKQQEYWEREVSRAERIFIIGAGVHIQDTHIWQTLERSLGFLIYVDPNPKQFLSWASDRNRDFVDCIPLSFEKALPVIVKQL